MDAQTRNAYFSQLGLKENNPGTWIGNESSQSDQWIASHSPVDGSLIGSVSESSKEDYDRAMSAALESQLAWRTVPAPERGEAVRIFGNKLRENKNALGALVSYEMGKSYQEGLGEVQEMIDICDYAVGLSRQLTGLTIKSERPDHFMMEQWHPLGVVGIISAFNFPVAVWAWNAFIAAICGNISIWKPSSKTPLCAIAIQNICNSVLKDNGYKAIFNLIIGKGSVIGEKFINDRRVPLISATGSTAMGIKVAKAVGGRLGKSILELGGNNAIIVDESANMDIAIPGIVFGSVGTAGQRCTSTRRIIIQEKIYDKFKDMLVKAYSQIKIGNPLDENNHMGPLIDKEAVSMYKSAIDKILEEGGKEIIGGEVLRGKGYESECYVSPAIYEVDNSFKIVQNETFAPILYLIKYKFLDEAIKIQNNVPQGLSSSIMTTKISESEEFLSSQGSDCGIANVNIGTSGAEIGGAFGGEKETGGGRESGSDSWKAYMRRQTNTINYSDDLPLAQGIKFDF